MKRFAILLIAAALLLSCKNNPEMPSELLVQQEFVSGSRARFTVGSRNPGAYYSFALTSPQDGNYDEPVETIVAQEIEWMEESLEYFTDADFLDVFCYRGSRQLSFTSLESDSDFKVVVFQIHPRTHKMMGEPVVRTFHTLPVNSYPDLTFDVSFSGDVLYIVPSDNTKTYYWEYDFTDLVLGAPYNYARNYAYSLVGMYLEYGFMDGEYDQGPITWNIQANDTQTKDGDRCTLVVVGCEDGEFTTGVTEVDFIYHPDAVEVLEIRLPDDEIRL